MTLQVPCDRGINCRGNIYTVKKFKRKTRGLAHPADQTCVASTPLHVTYKTKSTQYPKGAEHMT